jgi:ABC-type transport system involved in cytochrome c biogenesis ATPase subunit
VLDRLVEDLSGGRTRALVMRGAAGVGKTALLDHVAQRAEGGQVVFTTREPDEDWPGSRNWWSRACPNRTRAGCWTRC